MSITCKNDGCCPSKNNLSFKSHASCIMYITIETIAFECHFQLSPYWYIEHRNCKIIDFIGWHSRFEDAKFRLNEVRCNVIPQFGIRNS